MIAAYNLYLGGYLPKVSPKSSVHNKSELKSKYKSIVSLNNANPLVMVRLSDDTQAYALNVKEMSMELYEAAEDTMADTGDKIATNLKRVTDVFNKLLARSDEFGENNQKPSRPGGELRRLVESYNGELTQAGIGIDENGFLSVSEEKENLTVPEMFLKSLSDKAEKMSMNPMEYVEKKVYSYAHLYRSDIGSAYEPSVYSGMLFNSYC